MAKTKGEAGGAKNTGMTNRQTIAKTDAIGKAKAAARTSLGVSTRPGPKTIKPQGGKKPAKY